MDAGPYTPEVTDAGVVPTRTSDPVEAARLVREEGAAILTGVAGTGESAMAVARAVFAQHVRAVPEAAEVRAGGVMDLAVRRVSPEEALGVHTDGFSYGDDYPDYFLLLCAKDSAVGGESFFVDGYRLLDARAATPEGAGLVERMATVPVDQTEEGMHRSVSPLVGRTTTGRRMVRRFPDQRPAAASTDPAADAELIATWDHLCRTAATHAPRFRLAPGEVAVIDNYRMLHGREPYQDHERLMWRVWVWTDEAHGIPAGSLASDVRYARVPPSLASGDWPMIDPATSSCLPEHQPDPLEAAGVLARDGAVVVPGVATKEEAVAAAAAVLGDRVVQVKPQFEATASGYLADQAKLATTAPDARGRVRRFAPPDEVMTAHNDGFAFGDLAPDYLFLWCETPAAEGGESWVLDAGGLLDAIGADPAGAELARFCLTEPIDHSEPGFPPTPPAPVARDVGHGRVQVRHQPYLAAVMGPDEAAHAPMVTAWCDAVATARDRARRFTLRPGELLCIDNYRMLHGRDPYPAADGRKVVAIWGWTTDAVAIPDREIHLV
jgi:alpha-ketoglutarate-dependent taurine dioxygenase